MKLFRVEDRDGRGPYRPGLSAKWISDRDHPPPFFEELGIALGHVRFLFGDDEDGKCGCVSLDQLSLWFDRKELRRLKRMGFKVVQVRARRIVAETPTQVVFVPETD